MQAAHAKLETPPGRGGIAVITLTGPGVGQILSKVFRPRNGRSPGKLQPGRLQLGQLLGPQGPLDEALLCRAHDVWELNLHAGTALAKAAMETLARCGAVPSQASDADAALLRACGGGIYARELLETIPRCRSTLALKTVSAQHRQGLHALAGRILSKGIDPNLRRQLERACQRYPRCRKLIEGAEVVLLGPANAGKSVLANALVGRQVSIVHDRPGTTRDWVREETQMAGGLVWVTDTAGLWAQARGVDAQAMRRARQRSLGADLVCLVSPGAEAPAPGWLGSVPVLRVAGKRDIHPPGHSAHVAVSGKTGQGLSDLRQKIAAKLGLDRWDPSEPTAFTSRQADLAARAASQDDPRATLRALLGQDA